MEDHWALGLAIALAYAVAVAGGAAVRLRGTMAAVAIVVAVPALLAMPLMIPGERIGYRAGCMFVVTDLMFRLVDYYRISRVGAEQPTFGEFCRFLIPFPSLLVVFRDRRQQRGKMRMTWADGVRVVVGACGLAAGFLMLDVTARIAAFRESFLLDHIAKVAIFVFTIESISLGMFGLERIAGFAGPPIVQSAFLSRSVAGFWMRYNTRVHRWLYENVFLPSGGRRAPIRGVVLVFFVSAILHELAFDIALSRIDGYQFVFFMIQAPAVLASGFVERLARRGWAGIALAHVLTITWMTATSVFFFHGVQAIFPFIYVGESWLP